MACVQTISHVATAPPRVQVPSGSLVLWPILAEDSLRHHAWQKRQGLHGTHGIWRQPSGWHIPCSSGANILQLLLLRGLGPWVVVARRWRFRNDLGSEAHIHALVVGDTVLDVAPGATRRIEPR